MKLVIVFACALLSSLSSAAQQDSGTAVLWKDPGNIEGRDLLWGSGAEDRKPQPPFTFLEENLKGTVAKVVVKDARGDVWDVKLAEESHPEVVTNRLLWALGFAVQEMYYLHEGTIAGVKDLQRADKHIKADGKFVAARFRRRDPNITETGKWAFANSPFTGQKELSGLIILMALVNNWDTDADKNNAILSVKTPEGASEQWYIAQDVGASFGRFEGPQGTPIKWSLADFEKDGLVDRVEGDALILNYKAYGTPPTRVPLDHARWFADLVGRLSEAQLRAALTAGGANSTELEGFYRKLAAKIAELKAATGNTTRQ